MTSIVHVRVPAYENLTLEQIFSRFDQNAEVFMYLPDGKELRKTPKQWIVNVLATVAGKPFVDWIRSRINERNAQVVQEKQLSIPMSEDIAACFHASTAVSRKYYFTFARSCNFATFQICFAIFARVFELSFVLVRWGSK